MSASPIVDRAWARRYGVPGAVRARLQEIERRAREVRALVAARATEAPKDRGLRQLCRLIDTFLEDAECGALAAALRREPVELSDGAVGRRILESAMQTIERSVQRALVADDRRRSVRQRIEELQRRFGATVPWHLNRALEEYQLQDISDLRSGASLERSGMHLDIIEARLAGIEGEVLRVPTRLLEQAAWPAGVSVAELSLAAGRRRGGVAEHPSIRRRTVLRRALLAQIEALVGPRGDAVFSGSAERLAVETVRTTDTGAAEARADLDAAAIMLRGASVMRSQGEIQDPIAIVPPAPIAPGVGVATLFGSFVLLRRGLVSPVEATEGHITCGATVSCRVGGGASIVSRPIEEWGTPLFDHPASEGLRVVRSVTPAQVRVFARLDELSFLGQLVSRGVIVEAEAETPESVRVELALEHRDLRPDRRLVARSQRDPIVKVLCGIRRERVEAPIRDRPQVWRHSAISGEGVELLESEWRVLSEARRRSRVVLPRPIGVDMETDAYLYDVPSGLSLGWSASVRQLRERDPMQLIQPVAALWAALHRDVLRGHRPNSLALGLYHEDTIQFRPMIGAERDALMAVVVAAPVAVFTDAPHPMVPDVAGGLLAHARLGGPPLTRILVRWGTASPGSDGCMAILFMLELLAVRPLQLHADLDWSGLLRSLEKRAGEEGWFVDSERAGEMIDALARPEDQMLAFLQTLAVV